MQVKNIGTTAPLRRGIIRTALVTIVSSAFLMLTSAPSPVCTVYFYNPETNVNNFASLKREFDSYLARYGSFQFQPFSDRKVFENFLSSGRSGIFLVSSWHYRQFLSSRNMVPYLVGVAKGKSTQRKLLAARKDVASIAALAGGTVASAGNRDFTLTVLRDMLGTSNNNILNSLKILTVPKEIDALMSVGFGVAESAVTAESAMLRLAVVNPKQYGLLRRLAVAEETLLPIVLVPKNAADDAYRLLAVLKDMGGSPEGQSRLRLLGLDGLKRIGENETRMLGQ